MRHAVIMAGGSGTRFWPASRKNRPKQFLSLASDIPLVRQTFERVASLVGAEKTWIVTTAATAELTRTVVPEMPPGNVLAEPMGRDTAACAGYASHALLSVDPEAVCIVLPADHVIGEEDRFRASLTAGADQMRLTVSDAWREDAAKTRPWVPIKPPNGWKDHPLVMEINIRLSTAKRA